MADPLMADPLLADPLMTGPVAAAPGCCPRARTRRSGRRPLAARLLRGPSLAARCRRRNITGHPIQPGVGAQTIVESRQVAGDDVAGALQAGNMLANRLQRNADFVGDLGVEALTMFLQALQDFYQGSRSREGRMGERRQRG